MENRRAALLDAMGVARYVRRGVAAEQPESMQTVSIAADHAISPESDPLSTSQPTKKPAARLAPPLRLQPAKVAEPAGQAAPAVPDRTALDWPELRATVAACRLCNLCDSRAQTVFGVGDEHAAWMVVGEAPGADEDRQGEPFVGRAGQLLNAMLEAVGHPRATVYIANVLKCRPPANRDPLPEEVRQCLPNLHRQIELISPQLILCVGRVAAQNLLGVDTPLSQLRGKVHRLGVAQRPVVVTYHPAYLLRTPSEKRKAWVDLKFALEVANGCRT